MSAACPNCGAPMVEGRCSSVTCQNHNGPSAATKLIGETTGRPQGERVPINIDADVRERLRTLLYQPYMRGVGWSEFIDRAVSAAYEEAEDAN